jgi:hypothetical protein
VTADITLEIELNYGYDILDFKLQNNRFIKRYSHKKFMNMYTFNERTGNPFPTDISTSDAHSFSAVSGDYYHNDEVIGRTLSTLVDLVGANHARKSLDVGTGTNLAVARTLVGRGIDAYVLDSLGYDAENHRDSLFTIPPHFIKREEGIRHFCGMIEDINHPSSELRNEQFDLMTYWGVW